MRALHPLWREAALRWWRWALCELQRKDPTHPDLPMIVHRIRELSHA